MTCRDFIKQIQDKQDAAMQGGAVIELIVLPMRAAQMISTQAAKEDLSYQEFHVSDAGNVYVAGIKVLWSNSRLPDGNAWFRYGRRSPRR